MVRTERKPKSGRQRKEGTMISSKAKPATPEIRVWDPWVRFAHWALVAGFAVAYLSGDDEVDPLHVWAGYIVAGLVALRVLWGFIGPARARFSDFVYGPAEDLRYLKGLLRGSARRYLGHSPAGGAMVAALLICLAATVSTGLIAYGEQGNGPLAQIGTVLVRPAEADREDAEHSRPGRAGEGPETVMRELHDLLANITLGLVVLHIFGVALASVVHHENLVLAMINGRKRAENAGKARPAE
jgi:cytochrome b